MANEQKRQGGAEGTAQPLPEWMSYSAYTTASNGEREYTIVNLPQTYYGPSIPLGTNGVYVYGGPSSPAADAAGAPTTTDAVSAFESAASQVLSPTPDPETTEPAFISTQSIASVRSTSLGEEITSALSALSQATEASQSIESVFSLTSSAVSASSTASIESTQSTASVRSVSRESRTSVRIGSITSRRESRSSTRSVESTASVLSRESTSSTASAASLTSLASAASVVSVSSVSRTSQAARSTASTAIVASISSVSRISQSSLSTQSVASTSSTASSSPTAISGASSRFPTRDIIALSIGLFFALLLLILILVCLFRWRQRRNHLSVAQRRIPTDRSHSVHQSMFFGRGQPSDGRVMVQGTVFDLWTPEQRDARNRAQAQQRRSVSSWAGRTLALITGSRGSRNSGSGGSGGSRGSRRTGYSSIGVARRVSRTAKEDGMMESEVTPLVGHSSPPMSPPPFHSPPAPGSTSPLPPAPLTVPAFAGAAARQSASSYGTSPVVGSYSGNQSRLTLPLSLGSRPESPGDGEHETAELLIAQRATRSPELRMGRLSWFQRMGLIGTPTASAEGAPTAEEDAAAEQGSEPEEDEPLQPPEMTEIRPEGGSSLRSWLEMGGMVRSFPQPPPVAQSRGPAGVGPSAAIVGGSARPISTVSTNTVYHDAVSEQPGTSSTRPITPPPPAYAAAVPAPPAPSTPPRRRQVPPFPGHSRSVGASGSLLGSRTDLLDSPVPSPLRRSFNGFPESPSASWSRPQAPFSPDLDDELPPPPATAWRSSRGSDELISPIDLGTSPLLGRDRDEREERPEPRRSNSMKRFTFGSPYPALPEGPASPQRMREPKLPGSPRSLPPGAAPPSIRDSLSHKYSTQYDTVSSHEGAFSLNDPSMIADTLYNASTSMSSSSPRSSMHKGYGMLKGLGLDEPVPMPTSTFGKSKSSSGRQ